MNANKQRPNEKMPTDSGWLLKDRKLTFKWFEREQLPPLQDLMLTEYVPGTLSNSPLMKKITY